MVYDLMMLADILEAANQYGGILGLIGILITITIAVLSRKRKSLGYQVLNNVALLARGVPEQYGLSVHLAENVLRDPRVVTVRVRNTGNTPIQDTDYKKSISVENKEIGTIVAASYVDEQSAEIAGPLVIDGEASRVVTFAPELLNARESFDIQLLCDGPASIEVNSRVVGQTSTVKRVQAESGALSNLPVYFIGAGLAVLLLSLAMSQVAKPDSQIVVWVLAVCATVVYVVTLRWYLKSLKGSGWRL